MGYERDEAMRQQEATEAMIRMREPKAPSRGWNETIQSDEFKALSRPSDGPFMPCPAKVRKPTITLTSEPRPPKVIPDDVLGHDVTAIETNRLWTLDIQSGGGEDSLTVYIEVDKDGWMVGTGRINWTDHVIDFDADVSAILSHFFMCKFRQAEQMIKEHADERS